MKRVVIAALVSGFLYTGVSGHASAQGARQQKASFGKNLVQNWGEEQGQQGLNGDTIVTPPHWVTIGTLTYGAYTASGVPAPNAQAGNNFFIGCLGGHTVVAVFVQPGKRLVQC